MDIEKEHKVFEEYISDLGLVEFADWNFKLDECGEYIHEPTNISWGIWRQKQAEINDLKAKLEDAQVKDGFVLVPKEWQAAKSSAVPEGFRIVSLDFLKGINRIAVDEFYKWDLKKESMPQICEYLQDLSYYMVNNKTMIEAAQEK